MGKSTGHAAQAIKKKAAPARKEPAPIERSSPRGAALFALGLALLVLAVYWQVSTHAFVEYDIAQYITQNPYVLRGLTWDGVKWALTSGFGFAANWHPLTWWSHMLDVTMFGIEPRGHHLVNAGLHAANTALVFLVLVRLTGVRGRSLFVAALFGLHPMHVESVAWAVERKDVLSAFFGLLALLVWTGYARGGDMRSYLGALLLFVLALMAKPMLVTLPAVLFLLDVWPFRRLERGFARLALEKAPFFCCAVSSSIATVLAQHAGRAISNLAEVPLAWRATNSIWAWGQYALKAFWPTRLCAFYPLRDMTRAPVAVSLSALALLVVSYAAFRGRKHAPYLLVGWLWFLGMLVPVIGLVQVGDQAMADRYSYLPHLGLFIALAWGANELFDRWSVVRGARIAIAVVLVAASTYLTWKQLGTWSSTRAMAEQGLAVTEDNHKMHSFLAFSLSAEGKLEDAAKEFREALRIQPNDVYSLDNLGYTLLRLGRYQEAEPLFKRVLELKPSHSQAMNHLGGTYEVLNRLPEAIEWMKKAIVADPGNAKATNNLGWIYERMGQLPEAERTFRHALELWPGYVRAELRLGVVCFKQNRMDEAAQHLEIALASPLIIPNDKAEADQTLALVRQAQGKPR